MRSSLTANVRNTVYAHLAHFLPCGQQTLMKRAKKLRIGDEDDKLKQPLNSLKEGKVLDKNCNAGKFNCIEIKLFGHFR